MDTFSASDSPAPRPGKSGTSFVAKILGQLFALLVCLGLPVLVTTIAPVSYVKFTRHGETVSAEGDVCALFFIPFRHVSVPEIRKVDYRIHQPRKARNAKSEPSPEGFLQLYGDAGEPIELNVEASRAESTRDEIREFIADPQSTELKKFLFASWLFTFVFGGLVSLLPVLVAVGCLVALIQGIQRLCGVPADRVLFAAAAGHSAASRRRARRTRRPSPPVPDKPDRQEPPGLEDNPWTAEWDDRT